MSKVQEEIKVQRAFNKASTETLKLIELALENKLAFIYLKGVRDLMDSAIKEIGNKYDEKKKLEKTESDPFDPYKRKYFASKGFYQQLHAADMMGYKSEGTLVKYRKNGVLKEGIHWIRTVGRGISYNPEKCKEAIKKTKLG